MENEVMKEKEKKGDRKRGNKRERGCKVKRESYRVREL